MKQTFPYDDFIEYFPEFSDKDVNAVNSAGKSACLYLDTKVKGLPMDDSEHRIYALSLLTAHILTLRTQTNNPNGDGSQTIGRVRKATIGSVTVETDNPNGYTMTDWQFWLMQTQYGLEFLAFLESMAPIGWYMNTNDDSVRVI